MTAWQQWVQRPQTLRARKLLAQVHLWIGIAIGLYIFVIGISGSAIVFRRELAKKYSRNIVVVATSTSAISLEELNRRVRRVYPGYEIYSISEPKRSGAPYEVVLGDDKKRIARLFDPYTGADLGDPRSIADRVFGWLVDLHDNLLSGLTGRFVNGIGALFVTMLALTGVVIWWPGIKNWRRSMSVKRATNFARFNWDVHSAAGFWCSLFVLVWGVSGISLCFPGALNALVSSRLLTWITRLHFGRFGWFTEAVWTVAGLAPAVLAVTGALMWWHRVLSKKFRP